MTDKIILENVAKPYVIKKAKIKPKKKIIPDLRVIKKVMIKPKLLSIIFKKVKK